MELCRWFENLPSDFTLVCVAKPKPWWNSFGLFVGNTDAILVFQTFLYRKLSPVKTAFAQSTKCRVRLWPTKMSSSVRYYYFFVVWLYVFGVGFFYCYTRYTESCYGLPLRSRVRTFDACVHVSHLFSSMQIVNAASQFPCSSERRTVAANGDAPRAFKARPPDLLLCLHDTAVIVDYRTLPLFFSGILWFYVTSCRNNRMDLWGFRFMLVEFIRNTESYRDIRKINRNPKVSHSHTWFLIAVLNDGFAS